MHANVADKFCSKLVQKYFKSPKTQHYSMNFGVILCGGHHNLIVLKKNLRQQLFFFFYRENFTCTNRVERNTFFSAWSYKKVNNKAKQ